MPLLSQVPGGQAKERECGPEQMGAYAPLIYRWQPQDGTDPDGGGYWFRECFFHGRKSRHEITRIHPH